MSDDLEVQALDPWGDLPERAEAALAAGCDLLPVCHTLEATPGIAERLSRSDLAPRVAEARERLAAYRWRLEEAGRGAPPDLDTVRARLAQVTEEAETRAG